MRYQFFQKKMKIYVSNLNSRRQTVLQKHFLFQIFQSRALIRIFERIFQSETKSDKIGQSAWAKQTFTHDVKIGKFLQNMNKIQSFLPIVGW